MPLAKKGNDEWLGCLSMVFKSSFGSVAVPAWCLMPDAQMVSSAFDEGAALPTEHVHIVKDKETLQRYFVDVGVQMETTFLAPNPQIDMLYPLFMRGWTVVEAADYTTIKVQPCCTSWLCLGLEKFRNMNQAWPRGCGATMQSSWSIRFTMAWEDAARGELDEIFEGHYYTKRLLGFNRKERGSYTLASNEECTWLHSLRRIERSGLWIGGVRIPTKLRQFMWFVLESEMGPMTLVVPRSGVMKAIKSHSVAPGVAPREHRRNLELKTLQEAKEAKEGKQGKRNPLRGIKNGKEDMQVRNPRLQRQAVPHRRLPLVVIQLPKELSRLWQHGGADHGPE